MAIPLSYSAWVADVMNPANWGTQTDNNGNYWWVMQPNAGTVSQSAYGNYLRDFAASELTALGYANGARDGFVSYIDSSTGNEAIPGLIYNAQTKQYAIVPIQGESSFTGWGAADPVLGYIPLGSNGAAIGAQATAIRNAAYTGGGDMITGFLDAGGGVAIFMAAVGALAISGAGIGLANTVTEAVAAGSGTVTTTGMIAETTVAAGEVAAGEAAAQTVAVAQASSMTAAQVAAEINALTMTTALDAAAVNAATQAGIITAAEQATLLETVATGAIDLESTAGRNVLQKAIEENLKPPAELPPTNPVNPQTLPPAVEPPPVNAPMTAAEQAAKMLKDQAVKLATGAGGSAVIKALTGGTTTPPNRNAPVYLQRPQNLTNTGESGSVLPIALIVAALTLLG